MYNLLRYPLWALARLLVSLRYRIVVHGTEQIRGLRGGILILPNHCGNIDPVLLLTILWPSLRPRPMLLETTTCSAPPSSRSTRCWPPWAITAGRRRR
jgi:hypothetical protein